MLDIGISSSVFEKLAHESNNYFFLGLNISIATGIRMLTLEVGGDGQELIMEQLAYNPQVAYRQTAWDDLVVTERMIADINSCKF